MCCAPATRCTLGSSGRGLRLRSRPRGRVLNKSVRKLVERLRGRRSSSTPPPKPPQTDSLPHFSTELGKSGLTVFDDRALRFRSLTLASGDSAMVEDPGALQGAFKIRVAKREGFRREASTLVDRRYTGRGYQTKAAEPDPNLFTFVAYDEGELVGTVSIRIDSDRGLSADELYRDELDVLRQGGCRLCEFTRLAVDVVNVSKTVLAGLFHTAYLYAAKVHGCTFVVIEVNPRHVPFYRRALNFEPIGAERTNKRVNAAAVLLCASFESIADGLKKFGGQHERAASERSLFPYGFSPKEEAGILDRLKALETKTK
jgi:N-acyl amino acid synthase FeeM